MQAIPPHSDPAADAHASRAETWPRAGSSLALACRSAPPERRRALFLWLTWWHETARIPLTIHDIGVAEAKLAWWAAALHEAEQGVVQHPVLRELLALCSPQDELPPWPLWHRQLQALSTYLHQNRWLDEASLSRHIHETTALAAQGAAWLLGVRSPDGQAGAALWGVAMRRHHQLVRLGQDARSGWVHVPIDTLQQHGVKAHELVKPQADHLPAQLPDLLHALYAQASLATQQAALATAALPRSTRLALRPLAVAGAVLSAQGAASHAAGHRLLFERVTLTPLAKSWHAQKQAWRLWWGA